MLQLSLLTSKPKNIYFLRIETDLELGVFAAKAPLHILNREAHHDVCRAELVIHEPFMLGQLRLFGPHLGQMTRQGLYGSLSLFDQRTIGF